MKKVYISNISKAWPVDRQERLIAEKIPEWPDVPTYRDDLSAAKRRGQSREAMAERGYLLKPASPRSEVIAFASWPVLAWDTKDLGECWSAAKARGATLMALDTGAVLGPDSGADEWMAVSEDFVAKKRSAEAGGGRRIGAAASVKVRTEDVARRIALIKDDWPKPWPPTPELLQRASRERKIGRKTVLIPMAYSTAAKALGPRPKAQAAFQASLARAEANRKRRKSNEQT